MTTTQPSFTSPIVTVDVVLLSLKGGLLYTALVARDNEPYKGQWALPGGWVHAQEDQDDLATAKRILRDKLGVPSPYLEQLGTFAGSARDPRGWSVSIAYFALVPFETLSPQPQIACKWELVDDIRALPFDHLTILHTAVARVRSKSLYSSLPVQLMPETFTLSQLQKVYESLLGAPLDKRNFGRRMAELDILEEVPGLKTTGRASRPAQQYRVRPAATRQLAVADKNLGLK